VTEINDKEKEREQWVELLRAGWMFHRQMVKETTPEIIGEKSNDEHIFHQALSVAIMDAMNMIQQMEALGYFEEDDDLLSVPGPMG
tara:strand:- start:5029 stop:5286 length:258 start_codon:yes stop_codon:yes gene_type:complete